MNARNAPYSRPGRLRSRQHGERYRQCLGWCGQHFWSLGSENRFCKECDQKRKARSVASAYDEYEYPVVDVAVEWLGEPQAQEA